MRVRKANVASALATIAISLAVAPSPTRACATVSPFDAVGITREEAIVVWDPSTHTERFIRRAQFQTSAKDFGFLVPTPTKPELAEASDASFAALDQVVEDAREHVTEREWTGGCWMSMLFLSRAMKSAPVEVAASAVTVLETKTVAGLDATVLEAESADALVTWLNTHGYVQRPQIAAWLEPYVAAKYKITAFKYADSEGRPLGELLSKSVMLTFQTPEPFYPYREPSDTELQWGRLLRVFLIAPRKMEGLLGEARAPWSTETVFAAPLLGRDTKLANDLPRTLLPSDAWLTVINDHTQKRSDAEVYFAPAKDQDERKPPPRVTYKKIFIPFELGLLVTAVVVLIGRSVKRRRRRRR